VKTGGPRSKVPSVGGADPSTKSSDPPHPPSHTVKIVGHRIFQPFSAMLAGVHYLGGRARVGVPAGPRRPIGSPLFGSDGRAPGAQRRLTPEYLQWTLIQAFAQSLGNNTKFFFGEKVPHPPGLGSQGGDDHTPDSPV